MFAATERAIARMRAGQSVRAAARDEGIAPSTLYRQLGRIGVAARTRTVIVGAGALGRELREYMRRDGRTEEILTLDDGDYAHREGDEILIAIAAPKMREEVAQRLGRTCASFIAANVPTGNCSIGAGSLLLPGALVSVGAVLGAHCIVNVHSTVGHDVRLSDFCTLASHVDLMGHVTVGTRVTFGSGARVLPGLRIGDDATIGAGAVVVKDVPAGATVFGVPARAIA